MFCLRSCPAPHLRLHGTCPSHGTDHCHFSDHHNTKKKNCFPLGLCSAVFVYSTILTGTCDSFMSVSLCHEWAEKFCTCNSNGSERRGFWWWFLSQGILSKPFARTKLFIVLFYERSWCTWLLCAASALCWKASLQKSRPNCAAVQLTLEVC